MLIWISFQVRLFLTLISIKNYCCIRVTLSNLSCEKGFLIGMGRSPSSHFFLLFHNKIVKELSIIIVINKGYVIKIILCKQITPHWRRTHLIASPANLLFVNKLPKYVTPFLINLKLNILNKDLKLNDTGLPVLSTFFHPHLSDRLDTYLFCILLLDSILQFLGSIPCIPEIC